jgi:hypothetical protein
VATCYLESKTPMEKLDLTKKYKTYFTAKAKPELINIEPARYLSIAGKGDPSSKEFSSHIEALYPIAYAIKFAHKSNDKDFVVSKLEGLWWYDESKFPGRSITDASTDIPRSEWEFRLLIRLPDFVKETDVSAAKKKAFEEKGIPLADKVGFFEMHEGTCVQMLHVGPFSKEPESLMKIMEFCVKEGLKKNGHHHEIYLSDYRKVAEAKLRTILREPVK